MFHQSGDCGIKKGAFFNYGSYLSLEYILFTFHSTITIVDLGHHIMRCPRVSNGAHAKVKRRVYTMKLKPIIRKELVEKSMPKPRKDGRDNKLPPDVYKPEFEPIRTLVTERPSNTDPTKQVRQYVEVSVKRFNDNDGLPYVWVNMYQEAPNYTGYLKGKCVHFPLEMLYDIMEVLQDIDSKCEELHIE